MQYQHEILILSNSDIVDRPENSDWYLGQLDVILLFIIRLELARN